ncbi:unnamed protein product [Lymnaea stagnalis]|uniref:Ig-like domain-containing protein n=1 Tax=Lymnaea stagnalis TaxID=6523 RepID=A0AAV2HG99_LYMST
MKSKRSAMHFKNVTSATCVAILTMFTVFHNVEAKAKIEDFKLKITKATTRLSPTVIKVVPKMERLTIYPNDTVEFSCSVSGSNGTYAAISHNGLENRRKILTSSEMRVHVEFKISHAECSHAGQYMCKTGNMQGFSEVAIDIVVECITENARFYPEDKTRYFASARGLQGPTLTCTETSLGSSIALSIQREDGEILSKIEDSTLVNYTFARMQCTDTGTYSCVADSKTLSKMTTQKLDVSVNGCPPQICKHDKQVEIHEDEPLPFAFQICITKPHSPNVTGIYVNDTWIFLGKCHDGICFSYLNLVSRFVQLINLTINVSSLGEMGTKAIRIGTGYNYKDNYLNYSIIVVPKGTPEPKKTAQVGASSVATPESSITTLVVIIIGTVAGLIVVIAAIVIFLKRGKIKHFQLKLSKRCYNTADGLFLGARPAENTANNTDTASTAKTVQQVDTSATQSSTADTVQETRASVMSNGQQTVSLPLTSRLPDVAHSHHNGSVSYASSPADNASVNHSLNTMYCNSPYGRQLYGNPPYGSPLYGNPPYANVPYGNRPPDVVFEYPDGRIGHIPVITETVYEPEIGTVTYITRSPDVPVIYPDDPVPAMERRGEDLHMSGTFTNMAYIPDVMLTNMTYNPDATLSTLKYGTDGTLSNLTYNPDGTMTTLKYSTDSGQVNLPYNHDEKLSTLPYNADGTVVTLPYSLDGTSQPQVNHTQDVYQVTTTTNNNQFTDNDGVVYVTTGNTQVIKKTERVIHEEIRETVEFVSLDYGNAAAKPDATCEETQNEANRTYEEQQNLYHSR